MIYIKLEIYRKKIRLFSYIGIQDYEKSILSIVVLTQKSLCKSIPNKNKIISVIQKFRTKKYDIKNATKIVNKTSTIAILNIRY